MKKISLFLLLLPAITFAAPVSKNQARSIGENFFNNSIQVNRVQKKKANFISPQQPGMKKVRMSNGDSYAPYYIFNNEDGGFVIVAGDNCATPILGYSDEGSIDLDNMPIQLQELLQAYALEIQEAVDNNLQATEDVTEAWATYRRTPQAQTTTTAVSALIQTSWDQYPRYNNKCPSDPSLSSLGGHPTTGCVATAMAQVMKYWEYPKKGYGSKSYRSEYYGTLSADFGSTAYDWDNMPLKLSSSTSSTQNYAVAILMFHCGVAVSMNYNSDGQGSSGAFVVDVGYGQASAEKALTEYFGYASTVTGKKFDQSTTTAQWTNMLKTELNNKMPVLYAGYSPNGGGHAFICDGYDSNNKFHFNWGWGGQANGYFSLTALTPGNHNYSLGQQAVIGIKPKDGSAPAKNYDLYMNTDLTATNTSSSTSSEPNAYKFGKTMSFTAKVENNGTGAFNGNLKVAAFTDSGDFIAWSNESYHFSLNAGQNTVQKTYTFTGGMPFLPGKYRAYMYYQDDDETQSKLVKTDEGIFLTEYNNVAFTVKSSGSLKPVSSYRMDNIFGSWITGAKVRINVDVKNTSTSSNFNGKIRLCLLNEDGSLAEKIEEVDYSSTAFPANAIRTLTFFTELRAEPKTYNLTLQVKGNNQSEWSYMDCTSVYPNPVSVVVKAPALLADEYEPNNTQPQATTLQWEIDSEMEDFGTWTVSLHEDSDVDYYKLIFPSSNSYKLHVSLYDKLNQGGWHYVNGSAQFAYCIGNGTYSGTYVIDETITFEGPTILYFKVTPFGMNGLGYYELSGDIEEVVNPNIQDVTCEQARQIAAGLNNNTPTTETYNITGYVTETDGVVSRGQQIFWMADTENGGRIFQSYWCNVPEQIKVGDYVSVKGQILRYNSTYEIKHGDVLLLERKLSEGFDNIEVGTSATKILRDGQILILRGDKTYTLQGQEVK